MSPRVTEDLVLDGLTMANWLREPNNKVMLHSDQGSQYTSNRCKKLLKTSNMEASMSRHAMFEYIEMFYNPMRRHTHNNRVAPTVYE